MTGAEKVFQGMAGQMGGCMAMMGPMGGGGGPQGMEHPMPNMDEMRRRHLEMHRKVRVQERGSGDQKGK